MNNKIEQLGKQWCTEIVRDLNERRNSTAASLARLKNHGHYRDAHTVAIGMMDRMLAAALAAPAVANAANSDALPPLPDLPLLGDMGYSSNSSVNAGKSRQHYSAHQIREYAEAYARAAILAHAAPNAQLVVALKIGMECATDLLSDAPRSHVMEISGRIDTIRAALKDAGIK